MKYIAVIDLRKAKRFDLDVQEALVIEYLFQFFKSGNMKRKRFEEEPYYRITYDKILEDLFILNIQKQRLALVLKSLKDKKMIETKLYLGNQLYITFSNSPYLHFEWEPIIKSSLNKK